MSSMLQTRSSCGTIAPSEPCRAQARPHMPQASAKWRLFWRLAPRLLKQWDASGRLAAIYAGSTEATKHVRHDMQCWCTFPASRLQHHSCLRRWPCLQSMCRILLIAGPASFAA